MFDKVLVCLDGSKPALNALGAGLEMARAFGSEVLCLSVFDPAYLYTISAVSPGAVISAELITAQADEWHTQVEAAFEPLLREAPACVRTLREAGSPAEKILQAAEQESVGLIVLGSRGTGGFQRLLLGSVSDRVVHHARCPVMVMR